MRLPIKYELLFRGEDVEATIDVGLDQFPAETHNRSRQIALTKRLKNTLKPKELMLRLLYCNLVYSMNIL